MTCSKRSSWIHRKNGSIWVLGLPASNNGIFALIFWVLLCLQRLTRTEWTLSPCNQTRIPNCAHKTSANLESTFLLALRVVCLAACNCGRRLRRGKLYRGFGQLITLAGRTGIAGFALRLCSSLWLSLLPSTVQVVFWSTTAVACCRNLWKMNRNLPFIYSPLQFISIY